MKIIAFYLPQFHDIPENDEWWGKGFTEWTTVKAAKPLYKGHYQPQVPLNQNYYNLLDDDVKIWQAKIAKENGIYGFCYYHYWFGGKMLLEKPMEQMLANKKIDIPFCICWANEPWTKIWVGEKKVLYPQKYGDRKEWKEHFDYMLPFFKDDRYIQKDGKPFVFIYRPDIIPCLAEMVTYWKELALEAGFKGLTVAGKYIDVNYVHTEQFKCLDYNIEWQPRSVKQSIKHVNSQNPLKIMRRKIYEAISNHFGIDAYDYSLVSYLRRRKEKKVEEYDDVWNEIIRIKPLCKNSIPGAFVGWDNSPRFGEKGTIVKGKTPQKFKNYLSKQIKHAKEDYHEDMIFLFAWNEWAEGSYLEPDEENGFAYLEAVKTALLENDKR